ncbi:hypothetical protein GC176_28035 [bacterium]|nr:hypothetical protein [bacterium]
MRNLALLFLVAILPVMTGCAESTDSAATTGTASAELAADAAATETASAPVNKNCPIMGHEISADGGTTTWNGKTIGFCCEGCAPKFDALSDDEKAAKLAAADGGEHAEHGEAEPAAESSEGSADADTQS